MNFRSLMTAICVLATANLAAAAPFAYVVNSGTKNVSVIDTADNTIKATVALPIDSPNGLPDAYGVAVGASGQYVYVGLRDANEIAIIDTASNVVVKRIGLGTDSPGGLAVNAAETRLYVASNKSNTLIIIDIAWIHLGFPAAEITRVATVDDASISGPEGVVLSPAGDKAYVANGLNGTVAEIAVNEALNTYTRTALITVGSKPRGLALSSTGSKLYVADLYGDAAVVTTADRVVTPLTVAGGYTVALLNDSKIYAPASVDDALDIINGTTVTRGAKFSVGLSPWGSAVAPNTSLYLTMNFSDNVKVFNTSTDALSTTIALPAGAKPTSFGDFIGPVFTRTITSSADAGGNCPILPLGAIAVAEASSRKFSITPAAGKTCDVLVNGVTVTGQPTGYEFTNVTANHTIATVEIPTGTYRTVAASWTSSVGGYLVSTPYGINKGSSSAKFTDGSTVTLKCGTGFTANANGWTGACVGNVVSGTCTLANVTADKVAGAVCELAPAGTGPIYNTKGTYHQTLAEATAAAALDDIIKISTDFILGGTTTGTVARVTLSGNWDPSFGAQAGSKSMGALTITNVGVIANNLTL